MAFTYRIITLGCPLNQAESAALETALRKKGLEPAGERPDVYIINSCAVTKTAARKSRKEARRARRENPAALIAIAGCYPQVEPDTIKKEIPEADVVIGTAGKKKLPEILAENLSPKKANKKVYYNIEKLHKKEKYEELELIDEFPRKRPVVKIQEGCNEFCTYCAVIHARGRPRSRQPEAIIDEIVSLAGRGYKEIVLAGTHLGLYGRDLEKINLAGLLRKIADLKANFRVRLASLEPTGITNELLEVISAYNRFCNHLYIPLQSGCDNILKKMGRNYSVRNYSDIVEKARKLLPGVSIMTDLIVGFPGESEEDHLKSLDTVRSLKFSKLHVFPYSPRPFTPAANFPEKVRPDIKRRRVEEMKSVGLELSLEFHKQFIAKNLHVLVERTYRNEEIFYAEGFSGNYILVRFPVKAENVDGKILPVKVKEAYGWGVEGTYEKFSRSAYT